MSGKSISQHSESDWNYVDALADDEIDFSDNPPIPREKLLQGVLRRGLVPLSDQQAVTVRIDDDLLEWFKNRGQGYQTQINAVLRAYKEAHTA
ncbi:MAG: BrnA antitoxin family protein [Magnetococcales bacterium]|nr:BrnA antitoxin family protein [Magnetococcales bacterium]